MSSNIESKLRNRVETCDKLPTLPAIAFQLVKLCGNDEMDLRLLADLMSKDPALSAKVLRTVNSPLYGLRCQVTTLSHAFALLGLHSIRTLALSFSLAAALRAEYTGDFDYEAYWRRSLLSALAAKSLGNWLRQLNQEELFLGGLLQDLGMLVLNETLPGAYGKLIAASEGDHDRLCVLEKANLGVDHAEVSHWLSQIWNLPEFLQFGLRGSHNPELAGDLPEESLSSVRCVALSGKLADVWLADDTRAAIAQASQAAEDLLGLDRKALQNILGKIAANVSSVSELFDVDLGSAEEINAVIEEAKRMLIKVSMETFEKFRQSQKSVSELSDENKSLKEKSQRDSLTGLYNRAYMEAFLSDQFDAACESSGELSVIFCDLDHFKKINDTYGHRSGDIILASVARVLSQEIRAGDLAARYGGEEFVIVLSGTGASDVVTVSERIRQAVACSPHATDTEELIDITVSMGCATLGKDSNFAKPEDLMHAADQAMYKAKEAGRNRVISSEGQPAQAAPSPVSSQEASSEPEEVEPGEETSTPSHFESPSQDLQRAAGSK